MITALVSLIVTASPCEKLETLAASKESPIQESVTQLERLATELGPVELKGCEDRACFESAVSQLRNLCRATSTLSSRPADRELLERIYARPELSHAREREPDAFRRLLSRALRWLDWLFEQRSAEDFARGTRLFVLGAAILAAAGALLRLASRRATRETMARSDSAPVLRPAPEYFANAEAALANQPRESLRQGLLALLSSLERRQFARPDRVDTNRELLDELPARGAPEPVCRAVREAIDWYDQAYYSLRPIGRPEASGFLARVRSVAQLLEPTP